MKFVIFTLALITCQSFLFAQIPNTDSVRTIETEILEYQDSDLTILHQGRKMLTDHLEKDKLDSEYGFLYNYSACRHGRGSIFT